MLALLAQLQPFGAGWSIFEIAKWIIIIAAVIAIVWVFLKVAGVTPPWWLVQIVLIVVVAIVAILAIRFVMLI